MDIRVERINLITPYRNYHKPRLAVKLDFLFVSIYMCISFILYVLDCFISLIACGKLKNQYVLIVH